jgi:hypothetical protein
METVIELRSLTRAGWFEELTSGLSVASEVTPSSLSELRAPPGTFGASATEKFKARLQTAAQLASVLSASIALYHSGAGGTVKTCELSITDGATSAALVVPCEASQSPAFARTLEGALAKLQREPTSITISPMDATRS